MLVRQTSWIAWALLKDWRASLLLGRARALSSPVTPCPFFRIQTPCETNQELRRHGRTKPIKKWYWETTVMKIDKRCKLQGTKQKNSHNLLDLGTWLTTGSSRGERGNEREEGREGEKEEGRELPMMQAESRMVPSEGRSHTRLQQALHCVYPTAANVASTTTNYSQVKDLILQEKKPL